MHRMKSIFHVPKKWMRQQKAFQIVTDIRNAENNGSKPLARALSSTLQAVVNQEETEWIDKIELMRRELNSSTEPLSIVDYGAGSPDLSLSDEEMHEGRSMTKTIGEVSRIASKSYLWSLLLFNLVREFKPKNCLELGTCVGISGAYQAAALKLNGSGNLTTLEGSGPSAAIAEKNFNELGLDNVTVVVGRFQDTLDTVLHRSGRIDYAFIDGHHDENATIHYFEQILPFLTEEAVLVFDDIGWSGGMKNAWNAIQNHPTVGVSVDLSSMGVCLTGLQIGQRKHFSLSLQ